jgi:phenylacetate-coenzyme A ligase PaaK-like adenylate-forming protein
VDVKGKLITMAEVEDIIYAHPESRPMPIQIIREEPQPQDKYRVRVCYNSALVKNLEEYKLKVAQELNERLGVDVEAEVITPEQVTRVYHKYVRVIKEKRRS